MNHLAARQDRILHDFAVMSKQACQCLPPRLMEYVVHEDVEGIATHVDQIAAPSSLLHLPML
jgi:hypothetical protein